MICSARGLSLMIAASLALSCGYLEVENLDEADDNPCWTRSGGDLCTDPFAPVCPEGRTPLYLTDDRDDEDDGGIFAYNLRSEDYSKCATLWVHETGDYNVFGGNFAGSCASQLDETAFFTIRNSCNAEGHPAQRNAGDRYVVMDPDNTRPCLTDEECGDGRSCSGEGVDSCCVPDRVFLGTFLLVADEPNELCLNHWCPVYVEEVAAGRDPGFVLDGCAHGNSLHMGVAGFSGCLDSQTVHRCSWGCVEGGCLPDPCDAMSCPAFCKDGVCLDEDPCARTYCEHGCVRGRCLQNRNARGPDADGDGFSDLADCDDGNAAANPDQPEVCLNSTDDDCDGAVDESDCR